MMRALRKGHAVNFKVTRAIRIVEHVFGLGFCTIAEAMEFVGGRL